MKDKKYHKLMPMIMINRVTSVIKTWLENYFYDIEDNEKIIDMIFQFISIAKVMIGSPASNVENLLKKKLQTSANLKAQKLQSPILSLEVLFYSFPYSFFS